MLKIRYQRGGRKKRPFFRIVLADQKSRRDGRVIQYLGHYDPITKDLSLDVANSLQRLAQGAKLSDPVTNLFLRLNLINHVNGGSTV